MGGAGFINDGQGYSSSNGHRGLYGSMSMLFGQGIVKVKVISWSQPPSAHKGLILTGGLIATESVRIVRIRENRSRGWVNSDTHKISGGLIDHSTYYCMLR